MPVKRAVDTADRLHSVAIHILRRLRRVDSASGLSAPRLSALSVVVFAGPLTLGALADAEQVRRPTMTRLVQALVRAGYVRRLRDVRDGRLVQIAATAKGVRVMRAGRARRVRMLRGLLRTQPPAEGAVVRRAVIALEGVFGGRHVARAGGRAR